MRKNPRKNQSGLGPIGATSMGVYSCKNTQEFDRNCAAFLLTRSLDPLPLHVKRKLREALKNAKLK